MAILIRSRESSGQGRKIDLKFLNEFCVELSICGNEVLVRYPPEAPPGFLLDDVLQLALNPLLESLGGFMIHGACLVKHGQAMILAGTSGAGKSTAAFLLSRLGFDCFADDGVLVIPDGSQLRVWPFERELSLRPTAFSLVEAHGVPLGQYRREGRKYYFPVHPPCQTPAHLVSMCFLRERTDGATQVRVMTQAETLNELLSEPSYLSFAVSDRHENCARILGAKLRRAVDVRMGGDLVEGVTALGSLLEEADAGRMLKRILPSRSRAKKRVLRSAFLARAEDGLHEVIPLLTDWDAQIVRGAHASLQNQPLVQLIPEPGFATAAWPADGPSRLPWFPTEAVIEGCARLLKQVRPEVFDLLMPVWCQIAPAVIPFLFRVAASDFPEVVPWLRQAWAQSAVGQMMPATVFRWQSPPLQDTSLAARLAIVVSLEDDNQVQATGRILADLDPRSALAVAPAARDLKTFGRLFPALARQWLNKNYPVRFVRSFPVDALTSEEAQNLLAMRQLTDPLPVSAAFNGCARWKILSRPPGILETAGLNPNRYLSPATPDEAAH